MQTSMIEWLYGPDAPTSWRPMSSAPPNRAIMLREGSRMVGAIWKDGCWTAGRAGVVDIIPDAWVPAEINIYAD